MTDVTESEVKMMRNREGWLWSTFIIAAVLFSFSFLGWVLQNQIEAGSIISQSIDALRK